jgi:hypothetical protein
MLKVKTFYLFTNITQIQLLQHHLIYQIKHRADGLVAIYQYSFYAGGSPCNNIAFAVADEVGQGRINIILFYTPYQ